MTVVVSNCLNFMRPRCCLNMGNVQDPDLPGAHTFDIDRAALAAAGTSPTPAAELAARGDGAGINSVAT